MLADIQDFSCGAATAGCLALRGQPKENQRPEFLQLRSSDQRRPPMAAASRLKRYGPPVDVVFRPGATGSFRVAAGVAKEPFVTRFPS